MNPTPQLPLCRRGGLVIAALAAACSGPALALDASDDSGRAAESSITVTMTQTATAGAGLAALPLSDTGTPFSTSTQTMVWAGRGPMALGFGVEQRWRAPAWALAPQAVPADRDGPLVLGLALRTSPSTQLVWQTKTDLRGSSTLGEPTGSTLSLDLRHTDAYRTLLRGSLRMELARGTAITLKPRGRRIGVALTSQW
jgi:hypothetical protein